MRRTFPPLRVTSSPSAGIGAERTIERKGSVVCLQYFNHGLSACNFSLGFVDHENVRNMTRQRTGFNGDMNSVPGAVLAQLLRRKDYELPNKLL